MECPAILIWTNEDRSTAHQETSGKSEGCWELRVTLVHSHKCLNMDFRAPVHTSSFEKCSSHVPLLCSYWGLRTREENEENSSHPVLVTKRITSMQVLNLLCLCTHGDTATDTRIARSDNQPGCLVINGWSLLKWKEWNITMSNHMFWNKPVVFSNC